MFAKWFQLIMSAGTVVVGVLLALVFAAGTEMAPLGWLFAALGTVGVVTWTVLPGSRSRT